MIKVIGVRFRKAGKVYYFDPAQMEIKMGDHVIVETARGIETAASGGNREELLGQRPARRECRPRHDADAGCRNPISGGHSKSFICSPESCGLLTFPPPKVKNPAEKRSRWFKKQFGCVILEAKVPVGRGNRRA